MSESIAFYDYSIFGLKVRSALPIPELTEARWQGTADVTIANSSLQSRETRSGYNMFGEEILLDIPEVARFSITGGKSILVDPVAGAPARNVRLYLLGSGIGALLHQRRLLPLHANAVEIGDAAIAFTGKSGAGKSTLAAWFHDQGFRVIADDICVVGTDDGNVPCVYPGIPRLRLWQDVLEATGRNTSDFERSYVDDGLWNKFDVPISSTSQLSEPLKLHALYVLDKGESVRFQPLSGLEAAEAVFANTYRGGVIAELGAERDHMSAAIALVKAVPIFRFYRPWSIGERDRIGQHIIEHVTEHVRKASSK